MAVAAASQALPPIRTALQRNYQSRIIGAEWGWCLIAHHDALSAYLTWFVEQREAFCVDAGVARPGPMQSSRSAVVIPFRRKVTTYLRHPDERLRPSLSIAPLPPSCAASAWRACCAHGMKFFRCPPSAVTSAILCNAVRIS